MLPLEGVRVIEFCNVAAGPFCGMLLADMGADVIKVEHPQGGDTMRAWPPITDGYSENFASLNRNKRSVTLDLKEPAGPRSRRARLVLGADVLIENNRPGVMDAPGPGLRGLCSATSPRSSIARSPPSARKGRARRRAASTSRCRR